MPSFSATKWSTCPTQQSCCKTKWATTTFMAKSCPETISWKSPTDHLSSPLKPTISSSLKILFIMSSKRMYWPKNNSRIPPVKPSVYCWLASTPAKINRQVMMQECLSLKCRKKIASSNKINPSWDTFNAGLLPFINISTPKKAPSTFSSTTKTWTALKSLSKKVIKPEPHLPLMIKWPIKIPWFIKMLMKDRMQFQLRPNTLAALTPFKPSVQLQKSNNSKEAFSVTRISKQMRLTTFYTKISETSLSR